MSPASSEEETLETGLFHLLFPQTDTHSYGIRKSALKCMVRKWGLMCVRRVKKGCSCINFYL